MNCCFNMGDLQAQYTKWKKPSSKGDTPCDCIYPMGWKRQNYGNRKQASGCQGLEGEGEIIAKEPTGILEVDGNILYLDCGHWYMTVYVFQKN